MEIQKTVQLVALRSPAMDRIATTPAISVGRVVLLFLLMITYETCTAIGGKKAMAFLPSPLSVNIAQILQYDPMILEVTQSSLTTKKEAALTGCHFVCRSLRGFAPAGSSLFSPYVEARSADDCGNENPERDIRPR